MKPWKRTCVRTGFAAQSRGGSILPQEEPMDVFCPHCLQSVTLEGRDPGDYSFDCPECAGEVLVTISQDSSARPQVRPVRSKPAVHDSKFPKAHSAPSLTGSRGSQDSFRASHRKS